MEFRVLSIDAWADGQSCPECGSHKVMEQVSKPGMKCSACQHIFDENEGIYWSWNNLFKAGTYSENAYGPLTDKNAIKYFQDNFQSSLGIISHFYEIEDDQYNLVLVRKDTRMPVLAIEYGNKY